VKSFIEFLVEEEKEVFKPVHGNEKMFPWKENKQHNDRQVKMAKGRITRARKAGKKPSERDMLIAHGREPSRGWT